MTGLRLTAGTPVFEWCDECLTRAVVGFAIWRLDGSGVHLFGSYRMCQRCEEDRDAAR